MDMFMAGLLISFVLTLGLTISARRGSQSVKPSSVDFKRFQQGFLTVYYIAMTADWLQGPYVYALYSSYGFSKHDIAVLFIGGFGASMVFGTFAGILSDKLGRKRSCIAYCVLYIISCCTKHAKDYNTLMLGRVTGGIATSLLFSAFESWMVCEHNARGYDASLLGDTFSLMYFGNSLCAIVSGVVAQWAADRQPLTRLGTGHWFFGGYCTPFDLSALCLVVTLLLIAPRWAENYGDAAGVGLDASADARTLSTKLLSPRIWLCGAVVSFFEGSMYIFVFNWTPTFSGGATPPPYGLIFASFMVACMGGSSLFTILSRQNSPDAIVRGLTLAAAAALAVPMVTGNKAAVLAAFLVFEGCVGLYWPAIGTVKSRIVPEEVRATVYNLFRVPLNGVVVAVLLNNMDTATAFFWCSLMLGGGFAASVMLHALPARERAAARGGLADAEADDASLIAAREQ